jgi:hypothetical protein
VKFVICKFSILSNFLNSLFEKSGEILSEEKKEMWLLFSLTSHNLLLQKINPARNDKTGKVTLRLGKNVVEKQ